MEQTFLYVLIGVIVVAVLLIGLAKRNAGSIEEE